MRPRLRPSTTPFCAQITPRDAPRGDSFASAAFPHHHHHHRSSSSSSSSSSLKNISLVLISLSSRPTFSRTFEKKAKKIILERPDCPKYFFETRLPPHKIQVSLRKSLYIPRANETSNGCALSFFLSFFLSFLPSFALRCDARFFFARVFDPRVRIVFRFIWTRVERSLPHPPLPALF